VDRRIQGLIDAITAGTMLLGDKRAYHEYLSDVKAAILARNLPRPSSEQPRSPTSAGNELPDQHRVPPSPAAPAVAMPPALREKSAIKSMDDFTDTDDLMKPIELSPHKQPPTPLHHQSEPIVIVSSGGLESPHSSPPNKRKRARRPDDS
jgi:hypothetical protein